jgi:hypothetical protein
MNQWLPIPSTLTLRRSIVALPLLRSLLVLRPTLQMCILSSLINSLSIRFWTMSPNMAHLPNSSATAHRLRLVNMSSRLFDPYTLPLGRVSHISSIRTLLNASTRTSNDCATSSLTALGLRHTLGFLVSFPCYVSTSGNLSTTSLTTVTFRLTHVRNMNILSVSASLSDMP